MAPAPTMSVRGTRMDRAARGARSTTSCATIGAADVLDRVRGVLTSCATMCAPGGSSIDGTRERKWIQTGEPSDRMHTRPT